MSRQQEFPPSTSPDHPQATITDLDPHYLKNIMTRLLCSEGEGRTFLERLPFCAGDTTGGTDTELQAVVTGGKHDVDLPCITEQSDYYANIAKRAAGGDTPKRLIADLERYAGSPQQP